MVDKCPECGVALETKMVRAPMSERGEEPVPFVAGTDDLHTAELCLGRQLAAAQVENVRLRDEAVKRERGYLEAALLAPKEERKEKWVICGSTWTIYAAEIVEAQAKEIRRLGGLIFRLHADAVGVKFDTGECAEAAKENPDG